LPVFFQDTRESIPSILKEHWQALQEVVRM